MNRRFFAKKLAGVAAALGLGGVVNAATPKQDGSSRLRLGEVLVFRRDQIVEYEITRTSEPHSWGCLYSVRRDDGSIEKRKSGQLLAVAFMGDQCVLVDSRVMSS